MSTLAHTVARSVLLDVAPEQVWEAITDERALSEWLAPEVEVEPQVGGEIVCRYEDGEERRGEVELVEEAERLAFHWWREEGGPSRVEFIVDAVAEGTRLTVIETSARVRTTMLASSWTASLGSLRLALGRLVHA
ncbi:MAG: hypothetical protein QOE56_1943 [Solirubrobacterales bacterium]|nr:hypothetical protein [Solirubrobacterales bacterium]